MTNFIEENKKLFVPTKTFRKLDLNLPKLDRVEVDGVRYYRVQNETEVEKYISVTSVTSHYNKDKFVQWRKKVGEEKANLITRAATSRGTASIRSMNTIFSIQWKIDSKRTRHFLGFYLGQFDHI
jgi:hypothetical protein